MWIFDCEFFKYLVTGYRLLKMESIVLCTAGWEENEMCRWDDGRVTPKIFSTRQKNSVIQRMIDLAHEDKYIGSSTFSKRFGKLDLAEKLGSNHLILLILLKK